MLLKRIRWSSLLRLVVIVGVAYAVGFAIIFYAIPYLAHRLGVTYNPGFYMTTAGMLYIIMTPMFLFFIGLTWHIYKESTDPIMMAVREKVVKEFMDSKQWEGLMDRLVKAEMQRILDFYFPPLKGSVKEKVRNKTYKVYKYIKESFQ